MNFKGNVHSQCIVCNSTNINMLGGYENHGLIKCKNCSFVFMSKIPSKSELDSHYSTYSYGKEQYLSPLTIKSYNLLLDEFEKFRKSNQILDVGCGVGFFLAEAKKRGWVVHGTEYSETAVATCSKKGIDVKKEMLNPENFEFQEFDVITSFEVIEHINNPNQYLYPIHQLLRKGGLFYCTTPNFNSLLRFYLKDKYNIIEYPEHLSYYTRSTLNKVVCNNGFKVHKFFSTGISISRFKVSAGISNERMMAGNSSDEILRKKIESKWYWSLAKQIANALLTLTNLGMTLKGYYVKN